MSAAAKGPLEFRPMQGLLSIADRAAHMARVGEWWDGEDGLRAVIETKLREMGIPDKPVPLSGEGAVTPRDLAEHAGFIKRRKRLKK